MSRLDPTPWQHAPPARGQPPNLNFQQLLASLPDYHQKNGHRVFPLIQFVSNF